MYLLLKGIERNSLALTGPNTDLWEELLIFKLQQGLASKDIKGLKQLSVCSVFAASFALSRVPVLGWIGNKVRLGNPIS